jgi:hypothetical protein
MKQHPICRCANPSCDFSAGSVSSFKDHVLVCELSVENLYYTCFHCAKQFKHVPTLLEHLRSHALKRFFCGLCDHKVNRPVQLPSTGTAAAYRYGCRLPVQLPPNGTAAAYTHFHEALFWIYGSGRIGIIMADPDPYTF